jgi:hypothetical protein
VKAGDAKLWVYRHMSDHDRQAAEDHEEQFFGIIRLAYDKSGFFYPESFSSLQEPLTVPKGLNASTIFFKKTTFGTFFVHGLPAKGGCVFSLVPG